MVRSVLDLEIELLRWRKNIEEVCGDEDMAGFFEERIKELEKTREMLQKLHGAVP